MVVETPLSTSVMAAATPAGPAPTMSADGELPDRELPDRELPDREPIVGVFEFCCFATRTG
jgi:hypothetical protein